MKAAAGAARRATRQPEQRGPCATSVLVSMQLAFGLRPIEAERVELGDLVQKPSCGETETTMRPSTSRIGWRSCRFQSRSVSPALEGGDGKSGRLKKSRTALRRRIWCATSPRRSSHGRPGLHVQRGHAPRVQLHEAVLHLDRAPWSCAASQLAARGQPSRRRAADPRCDRADKRRKLRFHRRDQHVVGRRLWVNTGIWRWIRVRRCRCGARRRYPRKCAPARSWRRIGWRRVGARRHKLVLDRASRPPAPSASIASTPDIGRALGEHRTCRGDMDDVGAAFRLSQPVVDRAGIEQQRSAITKASAAFNNSSAGRSAMMKPFCRKALLPPGPHLHLP